MNIKNEITEHEQMSFERLSSDVMMYMMNRYMLPKEIYICFQTSKIFWLFKPKELEVLKDVEKGLDYCIDNVCLEGLKWMRANVQVPKCGTKWDKYVFWRGSQIGTSVITDWIFSELPRPNLDIYDINIEIYFLLMNEFVIADRIKRYVYSRGVWFDSHCLFALNDLLRDVIVTYLKYLILDVNEKNEYKIKKEMHRCQKYSYAINRITPIQQKLIFDNNKNLIGMNNGVYDLKIRKLRNDILLSEERVHMRACEYREYKIDDPYIKEILEYLETIHPDIIMRERLLKKVASYLKGEQSVCVWYGVGANGKSIFRELMQLILGTYNSQLLTLEDVDIETFRNMKICTQERKTCLICITNNPIFVNEKDVEVVEWKTMFVRVNLEGIHEHGHRELKKNERPRDMNVKKKLMRWKSGFMWLLLNKYM